MSSDRESIKKTKILSLKLKALFSKRANHNLARKPFFMILIEVSITFYAYVEII